MPSYPTYRIQVQCYQPGSQIGRANIPLPIGAHTYHTMSFESCLQCLKVDTVPYFASWLKYDRWNLILNDFVDTYGRWLNDQGQASAPSSVCASVHPTELSVSICGMGEASTRSCHLKPVIEMGRSEVTPTVL